MPLFYQQDINETTRLAVWKIEETESFFSSTVPLQRQITHPHKRLQHLAARYLLRYLFPSFPYDEILVADTRRPYFADEKFHFSISHCGDYAAAIVSTKERVGIDVEIPALKIFRVVHKFLHPAEMAAFGQSEDTGSAAARTVADARLPTLLWCAKEALYKWWAHDEVDFSEAFQLDAFTAAPNGTISAHIVGNDETVHLPLAYLQLPQLCIVWACR